MNQNSNRAGFTLIELMLAMGFVSALLLAIAMSVIQISNIYNRGLTLKDVNQAGSALSNELQRGIASSSAFDLTVDGKNYVKKAWGGRLCTGKYSYAWNYGTANSESDVSRNVYNSLALIRQRGNINFIKVYDPATSYCVNGATGYPPFGADATELLDIGQHDLAIHDFSIITSSTAKDTTTKQQLYNISFIIGTNNKSALNGASCKLPNEKDADPNYCYVNNFNIITRAGNSLE